MILETERLILRPFEESDAEDVYEYAKDDRVGPIAGWPAHTSVENSREIIKNVLMVDETYAICLKDNRKAIGAVGLMTGESANIKIGDNEGEIGYWLGVPFWGQGIMPEAVCELVRHAFVDLKLINLWCGYFDGNEKSKRCQEKCGFTYHHTNMNIHWALMNDVRTEHITLLTREQWKNNISVRKLENHETESALSLAWKVFLEYEAPVYPDEGTEEFHRCLKDDEYLNGIDYYGAFCANTLTGILGIRKEIAHICFFFVDGKYQRLGIGRKLFDKAKEDFSGKTITLNSSPFGLPFYHSLGFKATGCEQTVNGIIFTPMKFTWEKSELNIVKLTERRDLKQKAAIWFSSKWNVPTEAYLESMEDSFFKTVPSWYLCLDGEKIIAGMGVIENDFHERTDLTPNVCAVFTEPGYRGRGIAGKLLKYVSEDMSAHNIDTLYLVTDHTGFYEKYGWKYLCDVKCDGNETSRMYIHYEQ